MGLWGESFSFKLRNIKLQMYKKLHLPEVIGFESYKRVIRQEQHVKAFN